LGGRIAGVPVEQLVRRFEPEQAEQQPPPPTPPLAYARSLVEYCSYVALRAETRSRHDHLGDRDFHSLTYDMMLAWEAPDQETEAEFQVRDTGRRVDRWHDAIQVQSLIRI
jgi:hypothetical protein